MAWAPDYITLDQLKGYLHIELADTTDDADLAVDITAASRAIDRHCNRQFGKVAAPELRYYTARPDTLRGRWVVPVDDLMSTTGVTVTIGGAPVTSYALEPINAAAEGKPWTRLVVATDSATQPTGEDNEVAITAPWGWTTVPVPVTLACRLQSGRFAARRDSPYGVAGSPDAGSELRLLARVDPDVGVSLGGFRRPRGAG